MSEVISKQLEGMDANEKAAFLSNHAMKVERDQFYDKPLNPGEISAAKERYTEGAIKRDMAIEAFNKVKAEHNEKVKAITKGISADLYAARTGTVQMKCDKYFVDDQEAGRMYIYSGDGELLEERALRSDEKQTRMMSIANTGTN